MRPLSKNGVEKLRKINNILKRFMSVNFANINRFSTNAGHHIQFPGYKSGRIQDRLILSFI